VAVVEEAQLADAARRVAIPKEAAAVDQGASVREVSSRVDFVEEQLSRMSSQSLSERLSRVERMCEAATQDAMRCQQQLRLKLNLSLAGITEFRSEKEVWEHRVFKLEQRLVQVDAECRRVACALVSTPSEETSKDIEELLHLGTRVSELDLEVAGMGGKHEQLNRQLAEVLSLPSAVNSKVDSLQDMMAGLGLRVKGAEASCQDLSERLPDVERAALRLRSLPNTLASKVDSIQEVVAGLDLRVKDAEARGQDLSERLPDADRLQQDLEALQLELEVVKEPPSCRRSSVTSSANLEAHRASKDWEGQQAW